jgi:predicted Zn-ribbon and HTH transcriptional regulator
MSRPTLEVADILRAQGNRFLEHYQSSISYQQLKVFRAVLACRTASLGGHLDVCSQCGFETGMSFNSCRNRHCPKCQARARERWIEARQQELLPTGYFHAVFTVPHQLNVFALTSPAVFYDLLFASATETLIDVARNPERLGADIGVLAILHSWGQNLLLHPHIHCVIPAGGLSADRTRWIRTQQRFLLPIRVLRKVFRGKFLDGLRRLYRSGQLRCEGPAAEFKDVNKFSRLLGPLYRQRWVVYAKKAMGGPEQVLRYLGRYTHRIAISNHRLIAFDGEHVTFRWKDYAHGGKQRTMKLTAQKFLRRFFLHVLPKGFVRIRHFGLLANRFRNQNLALARQLLANTEPQNSETPKTDAQQKSTLWHCPRCGSAMCVARRLTAQEINSS